MEEAAARAKRAATAMGRPQSEATKVPKEASPAKAVRATAGASKQHSSTPAHEAKPAADPASLVPSATVPPVTPAADPPESRTPTFQAPAVAPELVIKYQQGKERQELVMHIQDCGGQEVRPLYPPTRRALTL